MRNLLLLIKLELINRSHDDIAQLLEVPAMPFDVMYPDKAKEMKRMLLEYIKVLRSAHIGNIQNGGDNLVNGIQRNSLKIDSSGFPVAPRPINWSNVTKADLEPIYRLYITRHYRKFFAPSIFGNTLNHYRACMS